MSKDKIVPAQVEAPTFINGVLHLPGETAYANLTDLGVTSLDDPATVGLTKMPTSGESIAIVEIAAVAPHAPNPTEAQGIPPGSRTSGTGRILSPDDADAGEMSREMVGVETVVAKVIKK